MPAVHPSVQRVLHYLDQSELGRSVTSLEHLATIAELSPSRLMHVFTLSMGVPLRRYLLSLRVQCAAAALAAGHTVTESAYIAGFADAAHLTRSFRRMVGMTPTEILRRARDKPSSTT